MMRPAGRWLAAVAAAVVLVSCRGGTPSAALGAPAAPQTPPTPASTQATAAGAPAVAAAPRSAKGPVPPPAPLPEPPPMVAPAAAQAGTTADNALRIAIDLGDPDEAAAVRAALSRMEHAVFVRPGRSADLIIADYEITAPPDARDGARARFLVAAWAAAVPQRHDVFDLSRQALHDMFIGETTEWPAAGDAPRPVRPFVAASDAGRVAEALGIPRDRLAATRVPPDTLAATVETTPGAIALLRPTSLRPGLLPLVVDGYDPLRDPPQASPLATTRWVLGAAAARLEAASRLGWSAAAGPDPVGLMATGEIIPARCTNARLEAAGSDDIMFDSTRSLLLAADLTVMPLETALTDAGPPTPCVRTFVLQARTGPAAAMARAGADLVITAGNHAMDCWTGCLHRIAMADTLAALEAQGLAHAGMGPDLAAARTPAIVDRGGARFAFLGYDDIARGYYAAGEHRAGTAPLDLATLGDDVRAAAAQADYVVVGFSWGVEYTADPIPRQREAARIAVEAGADLILGNHPHWVQAAEVQDGALVLYALGNFVFDQNWSIPTTQSMTVEVGFAANGAGIRGYRLRPVAIRDLVRPEFVDPRTEGAEILKRVWDASDRLRR